MSTDLYLPYTATTNRENLPRLLRAVEQQRQLERHLGRSVEHRRFLFTDSAAPLPHDVGAFFDGGIFESDPFVRTAAGRRFNMSLLRNNAIAYGRTLGPAWTMLCDSDTVINPAPFVFPEGPFAIPQVYYQPGPDEDAVASLNLLQTTDQDLYAKGNSWFIVDRTLLNTFEFNADYSGYGWEDNDYCWRIEGAGYRIEITPNIVIHSFHPDSERRRDEAVMARNRALAKATRKLIENGVLHPRQPVPRMHVHQAYHPAWFAHVVLCPSRETLVWVSGDEDNFNYARYAWSGDTLQVQWPFHDLEHFQLADGSLVEVGLYRERRRERAARLDAQAAIIP